MPYYYKLDSSHKLDSAFSEYTDIIIKNCTTDRHQLLDCTRFELTICDSSLFDEEDAFIVAGAAVFFSDALYQRIRSLICERSESYFIVEGIDLKFEGRNYYYTMVVPDTIVNAGLNGKISSQNAGFLPLFRCGDNVFCNELFAQRIMDFKPNGLTLEKS